MVAVTGQDDPTALVDRGLTLCEEGRLEEALEPLGAAASSDDADVGPVAQGCLGNVLEELRRNDDAVAAYRRAMATGHPEAAPRAAFNLGVLLERLHTTTPDWRSMTTAYQVAIDSGHPEWAPMAMVNRAALLARVGWRHDAVDAYRAAIATGHPEQAPIAATNLGLLLTEMGMVDEAADAFRQAIESGHPDQGPKAMFNLAAMLEEEGSLADAADAYGLAVDSGHPDVAPVAEIALELLGRRDDSPSEQSPRHLRRLRGEVIALMPDAPGD